MACLSTTSFYMYAKNLDKRIPRVVAVMDIPQRSVIDASMVKIAKIHPENVPEGAFKSIDEVVGKRAEYPIAKGEQILNIHLAGSAVNSKAIADILPANTVGLGIPTDLTKCVGGKVRKNDLVSIYAVSNNNQNSGAVLLANNIEVLQIVDKSGSDINNTDKTDSNKEPAVVIVKVNPEMAQNIAGYMANSQFVLAIESNQQGG